MFNSSSPLRLARIPETPYCHNALFLVLYTASSMLFLHVLFPFVYQSHYLFTLFANYHTYFQVTLLVQQTLPQVASVVYINPSSRQLFPSLFTCVPTLATHQSTTYLLFALLIFYTSFNALNHNHCTYLIITYHNYQSYVISESQASRPQS